MARIDLKIDVTEAAALGEPAHIAMTVILPDPADMPDRPIVCFAKPGGGYSKGYYTVDLPGPARGAQADWHVARGWIFVAVDHLGVGESSLHGDGKRLNPSTLAAAAHDAERQLLERLAAGTLNTGFPRIDNPLKLGIGQSMGGMMTIVQQGRHHCYDGVAILGYSAVHTHPQHEPGTTPFTTPWFTRDTQLDEPLAIMNPQALAEAKLLAKDAGRKFVWGFHYDDVDRQIAEGDLINFEMAQRHEEERGGFEASPWSSLTLPTVVSASSLSPGVVATEAAAIRCPVLFAMGERDVSADPKGEPRAYLSATSVDLFICPRMGHMHNFASTRELFWKRIETWAEWVAIVAADTTHSTQAAGAGS
jgi:pimeloyl-ACP methyl ester carboxylesterase